MADLYKIQSGQQISKMVSSKTAKETDFSELLNIIQDTQTSFLKTIKFKVKKLMIKTKFFSMITIL